MGSFKVNLSLSVYALGGTDDLTDRLDSFEKKTPEIKFKLLIYESLLLYFAAKGYKFHLLVILFRS